MVLVLDVGGTFIKYALMDEDANILENDRVPTKIQDEEGYLDAITQIYKSYEGRVQSIAIAAPGIIDSEKGLLHTGGSMAFVRDFPLAKLLSERLSLPVTVENDGKAAALAEYWKGACQGKKNSVVIVLGTGVGGGIIINGEIYRGHQLIAGELSFIMEEASERSDFWRDAIGSKISAPRMIKAIGEELSMEESEITGERIFALAKEGNETALRGIRKYASRVARLIYNLHFILNPEIFAIGGGVSSQAILLEMIEEELGELFAAVPFETERPTVTTCQFNNRANLIGALYRHLQLQSKDFES